MGETAGSTLISRQKMTQKDEMCAWKSKQCKQRPPPSFPLPTPSFLLFEKRSSPLTARTPRLRSAAPQTTGSRCRQTLPSPSDPLQQRDARSAPETLRSDTIPRPASNTSREIQGHKTNPPENLGIWEWKTLHTVFPIYIMIHDLMIIYYDSHLPPGSPSCL